MCGVCRRAPACSWASRSQRCAHRGAGCRQKAKTPAEAYKRLSAAVNAGNGGALFDALDPETRWNWMSIQKFHREAYDIVLSNYPEGEIRERETRRFEHAATAPSARDCSSWTRRRRSCRCCVARAGGRPRSKTVQATTWRPRCWASGGRVELKRSKSGDWGYAGLGKRAEDDKNRAWHDLEAVRASAADFERAAARAGK
jgi:hypothetical protein